jgi:hypothetical protein
MRETGTQSLATRYSCLYQGTIRCEGDQSKRTKCKYCGSQIYTQQGLWGVFTWTGDGRYSLADAHRTFVRKSAADKYTTNDETYVVRWLPIESL